MSKDTAQAVEIVDVVRQGDKIILPESMSYQDAGMWIKRKQQEDEQDVAINEMIMCHPLEGVIALAKALQQKYGWTALVPTPTWFGDRPPAYISMEVGPNQVAQVPWGRIQIPKIEGYINTSATQKDGQWFFLLNGVVKQKHKKEIADLMAAARRLFKEDNIYQGKGIRISFNPPSVEFNIQDNIPRFLDLTRVREEELIFDADTKDQVETNLFTPIQYTEACRKASIPLKRGVLLEGPYGTGKTLTAFVAAKKCAENGWTFIYLDSVMQLKQAIQFARSYLPAVIFAEDIDQVLGTQDRDEKVNEILNDIDGIESKNNELIVCLTTNHVENISKAMLRPGRLDAVISIKPPDAEAAMQLMKLYGRGKIAEDADLTAVGHLMQGKIPAHIREVVERAKLAVINRACKEGKNPEEAFIVGKDLEIAAKSMLAHLELQKLPHEDKRHWAEKMGHAITALALEGFRQALTEKALPPGFTKELVQAMRETK